MEQLVARRAHNPKVISSSLIPATKESVERHGFEDIENTLRDGAVGSSSGS